MDSFCWCNWWRRPKTMISILTSPKFSLIWVTKVSEHLRLSWTQPSHTNQQTKPKQNKPKIWLKILFSFSLLSSIQSLTFLELVCYWRGFPWCIFPQRDCSWSSDCHQSEYQPHASTTHYQSLLKSFSFWFALSFFLIFFWFFFFDHLVWMDGCVFFWSCVLKWECSLDKCVNVMFEDLDYIMKLFDDEDREIQICAAMILGNLARNGTLQFLSLSLSIDPFLLFDNHSRDFSLPNTQYIFVWMNDSLTPDDSVQTNVTR